MKQSTACAYAIRAMCRLARREPSSYVPLDKLCEGTEMPRPFVGKTLQSLVRCRLLRSKKGPNGGFALARPAEDIRLSDIAHAVDGPQSMRTCCIGLASDRCDGKCPLHAQWKAANTVAEHAFDAVDLATLARTVLA